MSEFKYHKNDYHKNTLTNLISSPSSIDPLRLEQMAEAESISSYRNTNRNTNNTADNIENRDDKKRGEPEFDADAIQKRTLEKIRLIQSEQKEVLGHQLSEENRHQNGKARRRKKIQRFLTAAAACALVISLGTGAFASLSTDERLLQVLHADSQSQIKQLGEMHTSLNLTDSSDGYTVTIKEAISDRHNAWVLIELQAPQGVVLDEDLVLFDDIRIQMEREGGYGFGIYPISDDIADDNKLSYILDFSARNKLAGQELSITFADLKRNIVNEELSIIGEQMLEEGPWNFTVEIPKKDNTVSMWQWKQLQSGALQFAVMKLELSPLCLSMDMMKINNIIYWQLQNERVNVYLKDGTELSLNVSGSGSGGALIQYQYEFPYPIQLEQIERIEFCGEMLNW